MQLANRGRLLIRTADPAPFGTDNAFLLMLRSSTPELVIFPDSFEFRTSIGTSILFVTTGCDSGNLTNVPSCVSQEKIRGLYISDIVTYKAETVVNGPYHGPYLSRTCQIDQTWTDLNDVTCTSGKSFKSSNYTIYNVLK